MNDQIQIFKHAEFGEIRTSGTPDKPLFCLADVCRALDIKNVSDCKKRLKGAGVVSTEGCSTSVNQYGAKSTRTVLLTFVDEPNLYRCIFLSRKKEAESFQDWVTSEVLPTIRKHGAYMTDQALQRAISEPDFLIELANAIKKEREQRRLAEQQLAEQRQLVAEKDNKIDELHGQVADMKKQVSYLDLILGTTDSVTITQIAQDYGLSAIALNKILHEKRVQHKVGGQWILYSKYINEGYVRSEVIVYNDKGGLEHTKQNTKWTQKGRLFLYELLKKDGHMPLIEKQQQLLFDKAQ